MTYFAVLGTFIFPPLLAMLAVVPLDIWRRLLQRQGTINWEPYLIVLIHAVIALIYTTPWDNYLVASNVWWYNPALVTGIVIGYVPLEEYTFFVVQTLFTGLWTIGLMRYVFTSPAQIAARPGLRLGSSIVVLVIWVISTGLLLAGWTQGRYLTLILSWALVPVLIQAAFGADILLANWRLLLAAVVPPTLYLWAVDALALGWTTWVIDPAQTTGIKLGIIPIEEMVFFLMTNAIIVLGVTLMLSDVSKGRARELAAEIKRRRQPQTEEPGAT